MRTTALSSIHPAPDRSPDGLRSDAHVEITVSKRRALSKKEQDVLRCLALGKSGQETGAVLGISVCTVRVYVRNIMQKLDALNIPHAVTRGFQAGILDPWSVVEYMPSGASGVRRD